MALGGPGPLRNSHEEWTTCLPLSTGSSLDRNGGFARIGSVADDVRAKRHGW